MAPAVLTIVHCGVKSRSDRMQFHVQSAAGPPGFMPCRSTVGIRAVHRRHAALTGMSMHTDTMH